MSSTMSSQSWPDSRTFWRDKRVIVTGGAGFLGSFVVDKLRQRGAAEIIVPRSRDYDLRDVGAIRRLLGGGERGEGRLEIGDSGNGHQNGHPAIENRQSKIVNRKSSMALCAHCVSKNQKSTS
jgi:NAD(P)-dependent dehydrogenase (short-subunit alcohol dehydrogenase family)